MKDRLKDRLRDRSKDRSKDRKEYRKASIVLSNLTQVDTVFGYSNLQ